MTEQNEPVAGERITTGCPTVFLRSWDRKDAAGLVQHADNPRIAATLRDGFPSPYTLNDANRFIAMASRPASGLLLAIDLDGAAVGGIGITPLKDVYKKTAEIGYWLAEPFWGKGIATGAVTAMVPVAFEYFDIIRLQAGVFSSNAASMRVLEKCGFVREAVHQNAITKNGIVMDEVVYVRFREKKGLVKGIG
ncbi:GNAT family N-acetyltransferase [Methanogenium sp. S4BF]|uniref:GNAT family N-acetyltransferase n=1 Tax=Methanogenium sp. S4BF TaxID=1789226 RepID=UPI002417F4F4|nr:GNAT family protein [Methanogenium sp. S4BF]WFN33850.1 GNAT family N-acetyltransferase [Methanogenium sp. S4BF]